MLAGSAGLSQNFIRRTAAYYDLDAIFSPRGSKLYFLMSHEGPEKVQINVYPRPSKYPCPACFSVFEADQGQT